MNFIESEINKGKVLKELGDAKSPELEKYNLAKTELIRIKSADGLFDLPAMVTWPMNMDPNKKYPILVSIYGGPNAPTVKSPTAPYYGHNDHPLGSHPNRDCH